MKKVIFLLIFALLVNSSFGPNVNIALGKNERQNISKNSTSASNSSSKLFGIQVGAFKKLTKNTFHGLKNVRAYKGVDKIIRYVVPLESTNLDRSLELLAEIKKNNCPEAILVKKGENFAEGKDSLPKQNLAVKNLIVKSIKNKEKLAVEAVESEVWTPIDTLDLNNYSVPIHKDLSKLGIMGSIKELLNKIWCLVVNARFNERRKKEDGTYYLHKGVDLHLINKRDTVVSIFDGVVQQARNDKYGFGNYVQIIHTNGLVTISAHLSKFYVKKGDIVCSGQKIGLGGSTGHSTGPHLHLECLYYCEHIDPEDLFSFKDGSAKGEKAVFEENSKKKIYRTSVLQ